MGEFLNNLYNNDNFILYLSIAIGVLVVLFIIVYFCGKKDQKLEETKKLKLKELNSFKEVKSDIEEDNKLEVDKKDEVKENNQPLIVEDETQILPVINEEDRQKNEVTTTVFEPIVDIEEAKIDEINEKETLEKEISNPHMEKVANDLEKEISDLIKLKKEFNKIDVNKQIEESKDNQSFSSVYVRKEVDNSSPIDEFDLPTLKK